MNNLRMFIPLTKVDAEHRMVYGLATAEAEDRSGEICDYATTKPHYEKWSGEIAKATDGKSFGNVRVMHGNVAAGVVKTIAFNDDTKSIEIAAKIVDDAEWKKVQEGVYTGFSQGGEYVKRWKDDATGLQRYTANPHEVSLVDLPCLADSTFKMIKSAGVEEERKFAEAVRIDPQPKNEEVVAKAGELAKAAGRSETDWGSYLGPARDALVKAALPKPPEAPAAEAADTTVAQSDNRNETPREGNEYEQMWVSKRDGAQFKTKAEMLKHHADLDAAEKVAPGTKDVLDMLGQVAARHGIEKKDYSDDERKKMADKGQAMSDGSFPIATKADLENAIQAYGRAKDKDAAQKHITERAKALDATDMLPANWSGSTKEADKNANGGDLAKAKQWIVTSKGKDGKPNQSTHDSKDDAAAEADKRKGAGETDVSYAVKSMTIETLAKDLYSASCFAETLAQVRSFAASAEYQAYFNGGDDEFAGKLKAWVSDGCSLLVAMVQAEADKMSDADEPMMMAAGAKLSAKQVTELGKALDGKPVAALIEKAGKRNSKSDQDKIQAMHDSAVSLGATCDGGDDADKAHGHGDLAKALDIMTKERDDAKARGDALQKSIDTQILPMLKQILAQPMPMGTTHVVSKGDDDIDLTERLDKLQKEDPDAYRLAVIKIAQQNPLQLGLAR